MTVRDRHLIVEVLNQSFLGNKFYVMAARSTHVRSSRYVHHEMEGMVRCSHCVYKSVVTSYRRTTHSKRMSLLTNPHNEFAVHNSDKGFSDIWLHYKYVWNLFMGHMVLYCMKGLCCLVSVILLREGGKEKAQEYHVNIIIIVDPQKTRR